MNLKSQVEADLRKHEGVEAYVYKDSLGIDTIGVGRNLERGLSDDEINYLLSNDLNVVIKDLNMYFPWWSNAPYEVRRALMNMCFNLGAPRLSKFVNMLDALKRGDYSVAAGHALDSKWAKQVGSRAEEVASWMRSCQ